LGWSEKDATGIISRMHELSLRALLVQLGCVPDRPLAPPIVDASPALRFEDLTKPCRVPPGGTGQEKAEGASSEHAAADEEDDDAEAYRNWQEDAEWEAKVERLANSCTSTPGPAVVVDGCLSVGDGEHAADREDLIAKGFTHVFNCAGGYIKHGAEFYGDGVTYAEANCQDDDEYDILTEDFPAFTDFVDSARASDGVNYKIFSPHFLTLPSSHKPHSHCVCRSGIRALCRRNEPERLPLCRLRHDATSSTSP